jgi:hypothetical protein
MLAFQETDLYRAVLDLNVLARDIEADDYLNQGYFLESLLDRAMSMLVHLAKAQTCDDDTRKQSLDQIRVSACVCAALFDICRRKDNESRALLAKIVGLIGERSEALPRGPAERLAREIDGEKATSSRGRR